MTKLLTRAGSDTGAATPGSGGGVVVFCGVMLLSEGCSGGGEVIIFEHLFYVNDC
jgi:hypothetical protein